MSRPAKGRCLKGLMMKLNNIFSDNMVFAEKRPVRVFGTGKGHAKVTFLGETKECLNNDSETWTVTFDPKDAGGPYELEVELDGEKKIFKNVYVGIVCLLTGQSNAELPLKDTNTSKFLFRDNPALRSYFVDRPWNGRETLASEEGWYVAEKETIGNWSAIGYLAGTTISTETGKAVGMILCYQGASIIESWLPEFPVEGIDIAPEDLHPDHAYPDYKAFNTPKAIYTAMFKAFAPFAFNYMIWYQGESDTTGAEAAVYDRYVAELIKGVKELFGIPKFRTALVQIADFQPRDEWHPEWWTDIQNAQKRAADSDPDIELVVAKDICESNEIHPPTKNALSERIAQKLLYGSKVLPY